MAGKVADRVYVEVIPDFNKFFASLNKEVDKATKVIEKRMSSMGRAAEKAGEQFKNSFDDNVTSAMEKVERSTRGAANAVESMADQADRSFDQVEREARSAGDTIGDSIKRGSNKAERALAGLTRSIFKTVGAFAAMTAVMSGVYLSIALVSASIAGLGTALASIVNTLPTIVAGAGAVAAIFATVKVATSGMGEAFSAVAEGDAEKLAEAMDKLAPSAREVVTAFKDMYPRLQEIKQATQQAFFEGVGEELTKTADVLLGPISDGMTKVASASNGFLLSMLKIGQQSATVEFLEGSFDLASQAVSKMTGPIGNVVEGIIALGNAGLPAMEGFIDGLARATNGLGNFLKRAADVGVSQAFSELFDPEAIANGLAEMFQKALDFIAHNVPMLAESFLESKDAFFAAVLEVFSAIVEVLPEIIPSVLESIFALVEGIATTLAGSAPQLMEAALLFIQGLVDGIQQYLPTVIESVTTIVTNLVQGLVDAAPLLIEGAIALITGLVQALADNAPTIITGAVSIVDGLVTGLLENLPALLQAGIELLIGIGQGLAEGIPELIRIINTELVPGLLTTILEALPDLLKAGAEILTALAEGVAESVPELADTMVNEVYPTVLDSITENLPLIIEAGLELLMALVDGIVQGLPVMIEAFLTMLPTVIDALLEMLPLLIEAGFQLLVGLITGILEALPQLIVAVVELIPAITTALIEMLPDIIEAGIEIVIALIEGIVDSQWELQQAVVTEIIPALFEAMMKAGPKMLEAGGKAISRLWDGLKDKWPKVKEWFSGLPGKIVKAIGNVRNLLLNKAKDIINGFIRGIKDKFGEVKSTLGKLTDALPDWKGPDQVDRVLFRQPAYTIMEGFANDLGVGADRIVKPALAAITGGLADVPINASLTSASTPAMPDEFYLVGTIDLGDGIRQAVRMQVRANDKQTRRKVVTNSGANR